MTQVIQTATNPNSKALPPSLLRRIRVPKRGDKDASADLAALHWNQKRDLTELVRVSPYYTLSRLVLPSLIVACAAVVWFGGQFVFTKGGLSSSLSLMESLVVRFVIVGMVSTALYLEFWRRSLKAHIDGFILKVTTGVFHRRRLSIPLSSFVTISLEQTKGERALGYYSVELRSINLPGSGGITFPSLPKSKAQKFMEFISEQTNRTVGIAQPLKGQEL